MRKLGGTKFPGMKLALYVEYAEPGKVRHEVRWRESLLFRARSAAQT